MVSAAPFRICTGVALGLLVLTCPVSAQELPGFARNGVFVGVTAVPHFTLDGVTFDGTTYYETEQGDEALILPRLQPKSTFRGVAGFRLTRGSFEVGYERTAHEGTFMGLSGVATFQALNFDERIYFLTHGRVQPYGLLGLSLPRLTIKDGGVADDRVGDGSFHGFGVNIEPGVTVFPHPRVGIGAGYRYRVMWFDTAKGVSGTTYQLRPRFRETAGSFTTSVFFTF